MWDNYSSIPLNLIAVQGTKVQETLFHALLCYIVIQSVPEVIVQLIILHYPIGLLVMEPCMCRATFPNTSKEIDSSLLSSYKKYAVYTDNII